MPRNLLAHRVVDLRVSLDDRRSERDPVAKTESCPCLCDLVAEDGRRLRDLVPEPGCEAIGVGSDPQVLALVRAVVDVSDPVDAWGAGRIHRRHIEMHEGELELDAPRAALDAGRVRKPLQADEELVEYLGRTPPGRRREFQDGVEIEPVIVGAMNDRGADGPGSLGVD